MTPVLCPTCGFRNPAGASACASCGTPVAVTGAPSHALPPGSRLREGAYTVGKVLGQGGFGITYLGSDVRLARPVAIKELYPYGSVRSGRNVLPAGDWTPASFAEAKTRFREEAQTLGRFHHPGIVRVYAVFDENQTSYMVMEFLRGKSLGGLLEERNGPIPEADAVSWIRKVAEALTVVHGAGILHRDIKPDNIIVTQAGRAVLLDFGTAREFAAGRTHRMTAMLTPGYAPLEQYSQQARFGAYTDVYALAATLYHLLTGQLPVPALDRIQGVELPSVRSLNPAVSARAETAVMQGMQMEVAKRPQTVLQFLELLPPGPSPEPAPPAARPPVETAARPAPAPSGAGAPPAPSRPPAPRTPSPVPAGSLPRGAGSGRGTPAPLPPEFEPGEQRPRSRPLRRPVLRHTLAGHEKWVNAIAVSPNGTLLASGSQDNTVLLWSVLTGEARTRLAGHGGPLLGALGAIYTVAFSADGETVASGGNDDTVRLWEVRRGHLKRTVHTGSGNVNAVAFSPDGSLLAIGGQHARTELWDVASGRTLAFMGGHYTSVVAAAFSPDGQLLATGGEDGQVILWDVPSGEGRATLAEHRGGVRSVAFSRDGTLLATGSDDYTVQLWDMRRGILLSTLADHGAGVRCVAFSPDGRLLASGGDDLTVKLWDLRQVSLWYTLTGHAGSVTGTAFTPDSSMVASGSMDGTVQLWTIR